jgi:hypothetical protein
LVPVLVSRGAERVSSVSVCPFSKSREQRTEPIKPDAPVTTNFIAQYSPDYALTDDNAGVMVLNGPSALKCQDERE